MGTQDPTRIVSQLPYKFKYRDLEEIIGKLGKNRNQGIGTRE